MKKAIVLALIVAAAAVALAMTTGCTMQKSGPHSGCDYFQKTRGHQAHSQGDRIHNPNDCRYQHERHDTGIDSQTSDY